MRAIGRWAYHHAGQLALVVACLTLTITAWSYSGILRAACEDRNRRDALILHGVEQIAHDLQAAPSTIDPLREALAPRDCEAIYPRFPI